MSSPAPCRPRRSPPAACPPFSAASSRSPKGRPRRLGRLERRGHRVEHRGPRQDVALHRVVRPQAGARPRLRAVAGEVHRLAPRVHHRHLPPRHPGVGAAELGQHLGRRLPLAQQLQPAPLEAHVGRRLRCDGAHLRLGRGNDAPRAHHARLHRHAQEAAHGVARHDAEGGQLRRRGALPQRGRRGGEDQRDGEKETRGVHRRTGSSEDEKETAARESLRAARPLRECDEDAAAHLFNPRLVSSAPAESHITLSPILQIPTNRCAASSRRFPVALTAPARRLPA
jgi:hypothetical protein